MKRNHILALITSLGAVLAPAPARAEPFRVTWDIGSLAELTPANPTNSVFIEMQLTDGSMVGNGSTTVKIENLALIGGTWESALPDIGNVSELVGGFSLHDGPGGDNVVADRALGFRVTSSSAVLRFDVNFATSGVEDIPDFFQVALLDHDLSEILSVGTNGTAFVGMVLDGTNILVASGVDAVFAGERLAAGDQRFVNLSTPVITPVPEPATLIMLSVGALVLMRRKRASV